MTKHTITEVIRLLEAEWCHILGEMELLIQMNAIDTYLAINKLMDYALLVAITGIVILLYECYHYNHPVQSQQHTLTCNTAVCNHTI